MVTGGEEVTNAVLNFFNKGVKYQAINCTNVTFIPNKENPGSVSISPYHVT